MRRRPLIALLACAAPALAAGPAQAARPADHERLQARGGVATVAAKVAHARRDLREKLGPQGLLQVDERTGATRVLGRLDGPLTGESARDARAIALDYVRARPSVFGLDAADIAALRPGRRYRSAGLEQVEFRQTYRGIPAIDATLRANLTATGRLINVVGTPRHDLSVPSTEPAVSEAGALAAAEEAVGGRARGGSARLVIYDGATAPRLGWRLIVPVDSAHVHDVLVDATTGAVQRTQNYVKGANAAIHRNYPGAPAGGTEETASLNPYLTGGDAATSLTGPFAHTIADPDDVVTGPGAVTGGTEIAKSGGHFTFALTDVGACGNPICVWNPTVANSWLTNRNRDATQVHWFVSNFHDHLENTPAIGFDDAAGNFEGADAVLAQSMDGANTGGGLPDDDHVDNANMATYPDGTAPHMQMYLTTAQGGQSTGFDASVVYHEYTHGLVGRTIVDGEGVAAAGGAQGGAINEGTADWYALDYLHAQGLETDDPADLDVTAAAFAFGALRSEPTDCTPDDTASSDCPGGWTRHTGGYTYADFGTISQFGPEVHADGEIFTQAMWQVRAALIAEHGAATGIARARAIYTNGMRLVPPNPTFLDLRNGILAADAAAGFGDADEIWAVFAERGMGYFASARDASDVTPVADFSLPPEPGAPRGTVAGTIAEASSGTGQSGVEVAFAGHDTGIGPELSGTSDATGAYSIPDVPAGTYPLMRVSGGGLEQASAEDVTVAAGATLTRDFALRRNQAAAASGATVASFNGPNYAGSGCGPGGLIDSSQGTVWGTDRAGGDKFVVVRLAAPITLDAVDIDPTAGCGDDDTSSLGAYEVQASANGTTFTTVGSGTFGPGHLRRFNPVTLTSKPAGVQYVKLIAKGPQSTTGSGATYLDVSELRVFAAAGAPVAPAAVTAAPSNVTATGATLHGSVDPNGTATGYQFEYGPTTAYGSAVPLAPTALGSGDAAMAVQQTIAGLAPSSTYHYRVVAVRGATRVNGSDAQFTTTADGVAAPEVVTQAATAVSGGAATLHGTIDANGTATDYQFEYGPTPAYGSVAPAAPAPAGSGDAPVARAAELTGLTPGAVYHFRLVAVRGAQRTNGAGLTFSTNAAGPPMPAVSTGTAGAVTAASATLGATIDPNGEPTTFHFEYGETTAYGLKTADTAAGAGDVPTPVTTAVAGLEPSTTYHFRVVASNVNGTTAGADQSFTTGRLGETPATPADAVPAGPVVPGAAAPEAPRGLRGTAGKRARVTCEAGTGRITCTVRYAAAAGRGVQARLTRAGRVHARGSTRRARRGRVTVRATRTLRAGRYRLELRVGTGTRAERVRLALRLG